MNYARFILPGLVGAAVGVAYEGAGWYLNEYYPVKNLRPEPEAFWMDRASYDIFAKLNRWGMKNRKAYRIALDRLDRLFILEDSLLRRGKPPVIEDILRAKTFAHVCMKNARKLADDVTKPDECVELDHLIKELENLVEIHVLNVSQLCKNCPV